MTGVINNVQCMEVERERERENTIMDKEAEKQSFRSRHQRLRRFFLIGVHVYIVFHMLAWYMLNQKIWGKTAMVGVLSLAAGRINSAAIMVAMILLSIPLFGRLFCGWFCHLRGAIELADWVMVKIGLTEYRKLRDRNILLTTGFHWTFRGIALAILLTPVFFFWMSGKFHLDMNPEPLRPMADLPGYGGKLFAQGARINTHISLAFTDCLLVFGAILFILFVISFVMNYFYGQGAFCRILCPYAVLFSGLMNLNPFQKKITRVGDCTGCRKCSNNCAQGIDVSREIYHYNGKVVSRECIKCMQCIDICKEGVLADTASPAVSQITPRREYERRPWQNSQKHLQVIEPLSPTMDAISIIVGIVSGTVTSSLGGFWFYVGAIIGFIGFRKLTLFLLAREATKPTLRAR